MNHLYLMRAMIFDNPLGIDPQFRQLPLLSWAAVVNYFGRLRLSWCGYCGLAWHWFEKWGMKVYAGCCGCRQLYHGAAILSCRCGAAWQQPTTSNFTLEREEMRPWPWGWGFVLNFIYGSISQVVWVFRAFFL